MAHITRFPVVRHFRADPTLHVLHFKGGRVVRSGRGLAFWFLPLGTSLAEVPLDDRELPFLFHGRSADFQDVTVQGTVSWRVTSPDVLATRVDFTLDPERGTWREQPLETLAGFLTQRAQQLASSWLLKVPLARVLEDGIDVLTARLEDGMKSDDGLAAMGLEVLAVRLSAITPTAEMEKALMMPTRERIQQQADEATFSRRALAVEKERAIQENELNNQLELARREEELIAQRGANERKRANEQIAASRLQVEADAEFTRVAAEAEAERIRRVEEAEVAAERDRMDIYRDLPSSALLGLAAQKLAGSIHSIDHLNLSPDMLGPSLLRLLEAGATRLDAKTDGRE